MDSLTTITGIAERFFTLMGIEIESIQAEVEDEKRRIYRIVLKTPDSKLLIGVHGATLESLTHLISRLIEKSVGRSVLIHLEVNDYLQAKDERLYRYIESKIEYVVRTGEEVVLESLSGYERKKVHNYVSEKGIEGLSTKSIGEGEGRHLHLVFKGALPKVNMTLDEDGIGI